MTRRSMVLLVGAGVASAVSLAAAAGISKSSWAPMLRVFAFGLAGAVVAWRFRAAASPQEDSARAPLASAGDHIAGPPWLSSVPEGAPPGEDEPGPVRFRAQLLFAEAYGRRLVIDGLADTPGRGGVIGVPFSLSFSRPPSSLAEELFFEVVADCAKDGCHVEVDVADGHPTVRLTNSSNEFAVAAESASGLPHR